LPRPCWIPSITRVGWECKLNLSGFFRDRRLTFRLVLSRPEPFVDRLCGRPSTPESGPPTRTCGMQVRELRDYAARRGWEIADEYIDTGWGGARASRPELDRLMRDARQRRFDAVIVWKLDLWGQSVADCVRSIQELVSLGVRFLAVTQNLDTDESNPMSRFPLHILGAFGELEREMIRERVRAGLCAAKANGKAVGRPKRAFRRDEAMRLRAQRGGIAKISSTLFSLPLAGLTILVPSGRLVDGAVAPVGACQRATCGVICMQAEHKPERHSWDEPCCRCVRILPKPWRTRCLQASLSKQSSSCSLRVALGEPDPCV
jgi:DNA invertase Pin-like site-specific DNA recombinase